MSAVGFNPNGRDNELERLREIYSSINDVLRNIASAQDCLDALNVGAAKDYLKNAHWHAEQAKKVITTLGQAKNKKGQPQLALLIGGALTLMF